MVRHAAPAAFEVNYVIQTRTHSVRPSMLSSVYWYFSARSFESSEQWHRSDHLARRPSIVLRVARSMIFIRAGYAVTAVPNTSARYIYATCVALPPLGSRAVAVALP